MISGLPFLTDPDPLTSGEGALDPLGLGPIGDQLADQLLPGLRARMQRPRFLTAVAACAAVCEGLEDRRTSDGATPPYLVFEWLLVEAFVRANDPAATRGTPGGLKAQEAVAAKDVMCARTYLRVPSIFGYHGVYKPLARHMGLVDDQLRLGDAGYELLKAWEDEQGLPGFLESAVVDGEGRKCRLALRSAVDDGLAQGYTKRGGAWFGWQMLADHLIPARVGPREAALLTSLLKEQQGYPRGEVFALLEGQPLKDLEEDEIATHVLKPRASPALAARLDAVGAYEAACAVLEEAFEWLRYLSTRAQAAPITAREFREQERTATLAAALDGALLRAAECLSSMPLHVQQQFTELAKAFAGVRNSELLFEAVLQRHHRIQQAKQPDGKRDWFERAPGGATMVRIPYRLSDEPPAERHWARPYRIATVRSFLTDLEGAHARA